MFHMNVKMIISFLNVSLQDNIQNVLLFLMKLKLSYNKIYKCLCAKDLRNALS